MSVVEMIEIEKADGKVKEVFDDIKNTMGYIPNILHLTSINSNVLEAVWLNTKEILTMDEESQKFHILLRLLISNENSCEYCVGIYEGMLITKFDISKEELQTIKKDPSLAPLSKKFIRLLFFALKTFDNPKQSTLMDLEDLEQLGCTPKEIFDAVHNAKYMSVINTLASTFKVEVDI